MLKEALNLLITLDKAVYLNLANALEIGGYSLVIALVLGVPMGVLLGVNRFRGRRAMLFLVHLWLFLPLVSLGLFLAYVRTGSVPEPLVYIVWMALFIWPVFTALIADVLNRCDEAAIESAFAAGATRWQLYLTLVREYREGIFGAVTLGIARVFTEIGGFFLVLGVLHGKGFPLRPHTPLTDPVSNLAVAIGLVLFGAIIYLLIHLIQFKRVVR